MLDSFLKNLARLGIAGLIIFELLNALGILNFPLEFSWHGLIITDIVAWLVVEITSFALFKKTKKPLAGFIFFMVFVGLLADVLGDVAHFYGRFSWYDQATHFWGGIIVAVASIWIIRQLERTTIIKIGTVGLILFTLSLTALASTSYEIEEYLEDIFLNRSWLRLGDGPDTVNDILMNILGAGLTLVLYFTLVRGPKSQGTWLEHRSRDKKKN